MLTEDLMDILIALRDEQAKLQHQLKAIESAIAALDGSSNGSRLSVPRSSSAGQNGTRRRRRMSAAARAKISKATKARWAKYRAEKAKKAK
jgi:hypothetical protein